MMTYQTMDEQTTVAFFALKDILGRKDNDEIDEAKSAVRALKENFDPEAEPELDMVTHHLDRGSYGKAEESFVKFRGIIGDCQPPRDTF